MRLPADPAFALALLATALAGCASVATDVTIFDPAQKFAPTENVVILLDYPAQPYVKVALIDAQGSVGGSEAALLDEARKRARELGADALVRMEVNSVYQPPVRVYDPAYADAFYSRYRYPYLPFYYQPYGLALSPYDSYRWVGGGNVQILKAVAIKYTQERPRESRAAP
jgi:hypothetical protein